MRSKTSYIIIAAGILIIAGFFAANSMRIREGIALKITPAEASAPSKPIPLTTASARKPIVPSGSQTYSVSQPVTVWPKIIQATINPPDVHVGDIQHLNIVLEDDAPITVVDALIRTDHGTTTVPLSLVGPAAANTLVSPPYALDGNDHLVAANTGGSSGIINTAEADLQKLSYAADWTVKDTHDIYYKTTFLVEDAQGRSNTITLDWSDACGIPVVGSTTISSNCQESSLDGVNGNLTIATSVTLTLNAQFVITTGNALITHGSIVIGSGGNFVFKTINCVGGNAPGATQTMYATSSVACGVAGTSGTATCQAVGTWSGGYTSTSSLAADASQATFYQALTTSCGTYSYQSQTASCQSNGAYNNSYPLASPPSQSQQTMYQAASVCGGSCSSQTQFCTGSGWSPSNYTYSSCSVITPTTWYQDADGDGYGNPSVSEQACSQPTGYVANDTDCYDGNANAYPGSGYYSATNRGDGSYDYNCDGLQTLYLWPAGNGSCTAAPDSDCGSCPGACQEICPGWRTGGQPTYCGETDDTRWFNGSQECTYGCYVCNDWDVGAGLCN